MRLFLLILSFLVILANGEEVYVEKANAVIFRDGVAIFLKLCNGNFELIAQEPVSNINAIIADPDKRL